MRKYFLFILVSLMLLNGCVAEQNEMQIGLNFIRFYFGINDKSEELNTTTPFTQPEAIFADFEALGVQGYRQAVKTDLLWNGVEPTNDNWNFEGPDSVLMNSVGEPIVTLFALQYASPNGPWETANDTFDKVMDEDSIDYVTTVVKRYAPYVKYWEIGNEMDHWRASFDSGGRDLINGADEEKLPPNASEFTPEEQGVFLAQVSELIRENDPDAVILMPGIAGLDDYTVDTWLGGVVKGGGTDWFDVVNYHYYGSWEKFSLLRKSFTRKLAEYGISDKPVWETETGSSSNPDLVRRTNYPNSQESQASDVFRRLIQSYAYGDSYVSWHTYISSSEEFGDWSAYGLVSDKGERKLSYYAFKLLVDELIPFDSVEMVSTFSAMDGGVFEITTKTGELKYVAWGNSDYTLPANITQMTSVVPNDKGEFVWESVSAGETITLTEVPVIIK
ncbi:MAG: hypothetical protein WC897_03375 [Candidatus Gracilibacteria bacterium]